MALTAVTLVAMLVLGRHFPRYTLLLIPTAVFVMTMALKNSALARISQQPT